MMKSITHNGENYKYNEILHGAALSLGFVKSQSFAGQSYYKDGKRIADHMNHNQKWLTIHGESDTILLIAEHMSEEEVINALNSVNLTLEIAVNAFVKDMQEAWEAEMKYMNY